MPSFAELAAAALVGCGAAWLTIFALILLVFSVWTLRRRRRDEPWGVVSVPGLDAGDDRGTAGRR